MDYAYIIRQLKENATLFNHLLSDISGDIIKWKVHPESWCLLEIICHLYDEEREDFRMRLGHVLDNKEGMPPAIDPVGWVLERNYIGRDYEQMLAKFLQERAASVLWLETLVNPAWENSWEHPKYGPLTGHFYISNWLAHDYLHIRQITRVKYDYLKAVTGENVKYAGNWK